MEIQRGHRRSGKEGKGRRDGGKAGLWRETDRSPFLSGAESALSMLAEEQQGNGCRDRNGKESGAAGAVK